MADQDRRDDSMNDSKDESARKATPRSPNDRDPSRNRNADSIGEQDDVAEDRNLSGASTWLNLPDQPSNDRDASASSDSDADESDDNKNRSSNR